MTSTTYEAAYLLFRSELRSAVLRERVKQNTIAQPMNQTLLELEDARGLKARQTWAPVDNSFANHQDIRQALTDALQASLDGLGPKEVLALTSYVDGLSFKGLYARAT